MKEIPLSVTHSIQDHWDKMSDEDKVFHTLTGSPFYNRVQNGKKLAQMVQDMNSNVDEEFHMRTPQMPYTPGEEDK
jgi:hypothetical protein